MLRPKRQAYHFHSKGKPGWESVPEKDEFEGPRTLYEWSACLSSLSSWRAIYLCLVRCRAPHPIHFPQKCTLVNNCHLNHLSFPSWISICWLEKWVIESIGEWAAGGSPSYAFYYALPLMNPLLTMTDYELWITGWRNEKHSKISLPVTPYSLSFPFLHYPFWWIKK